MLKNGKVQLNNRTVLDPGTVCAPTAVTSDGKKIYLFADANIKTQGSSFEVLTHAQIPLSIW